MTTDRSSNADEVVVRPLTPDDVPFAATLHHDCLPGGFFARLGVGFLDTYYRSFVRSPWAICLVAELDGRPAGVLVATTESWQHYRFLVRRCGWRLGASGLAALAARPRVALWFLRSRSHRYARGLVRLVRQKLPSAPGSSHSSGGAPPDHATEGVVVHVAVAAHRRRHGIGRSLVEGYLTEARSRGTKRARLLTATDDDGARSFYERIGWVKAGDLVDADAKSWTRYERFV